MTQPEPTPKLTRRDFLRLTVHSLLTLGGALTVGGLLRFFSFQPDPPPPAEFDLGPAVNFPTNTSTILPQIPAILQNHGNTFTALSLKCTHLGCTVEQKGDSFECPCHGSRYDNKGQLVRGPAAKSLRELRVEKMADGNLRIYVD
jgi:nitrite reductase/ring-hydroxylating ferredoxin subunit